MDIRRNGSRPSIWAPAEYFTGRVRQDPVIDAPAPARVRSAVVTFDPGARTNWHTHPLGQTIHVLSGLGLACIEGEDVVELRPGDTVFFPPETRHWHGAAPDCAMSHLAIHEALDGVHVDWAEPVADADYLAAPA
jgi:quercetin dioxygenase-like cupin family protein